MSNKIDDLRAKRLLISNILFRCWHTILRIFLNIYLFKLTNDIKIIALYNIAFLVAHIFSYNLFAFIVKNAYRGIVNSVWLLGLSFVSLLIAYLWTSLPEYYIFVAIVFWFFNWMYWISYNINEFNFTKIENRWNFQWLKSSLKTLVAIIIPSLAWVIIWVNYFWYWYTIVFCLWILFYLSALFFWLQPAEYWDKEKFNIKKWMKKIFWSKDLTKLNINHWLLEFSISSNLIDVLLPILLFYYWMKEMDLGFLLSLFSIISVIATYLFGKFVKYKNYKLVYNILSFTFIISVIILLFYPSFFYVTLFSSIVNLIFRIIYIPQNVFTYNTLSLIKWHKSVVTEQMVIMESITVFAKILSFVLIYFIGVFDFLWVKILFWFLAFIVLISILLFSTIKVPDKA